MKKVLITGSSGFIGYHLCDALSKENIVLAPSRSELNLLDTGAVEEYVRSKEVDIVIHSATQRTLGLSEEHSQRVLKNNLCMFCNLERCSQYFEKMFFLGSGAEYSKEAYKPYMKEGYFSQNIPKDDYGFSKYLMTRIAYRASNLYNLRLFGIFGSHENYNYRFISNTICKSLLNKDIVIHQNVKFDYLYIDDFCEIMKRFLDIVPSYKEYNVCTGKSIEILEIAQLVKRLTGSSSKIIVENQGLGMEYSGNNERLLKEIDDILFTNNDIAVQELIKYYQNIEIKLEGNY